MSYFRRWMGSRRGFTLLEILLVVVIIGVLATLALPMYTRARERAKGAEAMVMLGRLIDAEKMYYLESPSNVFYKGTASSPFASVDWSTLGVDDPTALSGHMFQYYWTANPGGGMVSFIASSANLKYSAMLYSTGEATIERIQ